MRRPCSWCEGEFKKELAGRNTGKSHGVCQRHMVEIYKSMGKPLPPENETGGSFDLSTLSSDERKLLGLLFSVVKNRQTDRGTF